MVVEAGLEERVEVFRGAAVEQGADAVAGRDGPDVEQRPAVRAGLLVLHAALEGEQGGILQEEASVFPVKPTGDAQKPKLRIAGWAGASGRLGGVCQTRVDLGVAFCLIRSGYLIGRANN